MKIYKTLTTCLIFFTSVAQATEPLTYVVKKGDTVSTIAQKQIGNPIYSKDGSLAKLLALNPGIQNKDLLFPGQTLIIGQTENIHPMSSYQQQVEPAPARTIASEEISLPKKEAEESEIPHRLELSALYQMTTLSGTNGGTTANLNSGRDLLLCAAWKQEWTENFSTAIDGKFRSVSIEPSTNSNKSISSTDKNISGLGLTVEEKISQKVSLSVGASYENQLFFHGLDSNSLVVDAVPIPDFNVGAHWIAYERGKTALGFNASFDYLMSSTTDGYSIHSGTAYQGQFFIQHKYGTNSSVQLGLGYEDRAQNTSILNFHEKSFGATLLFSIPLFE